MSTHIAAEKGEIAESVLLPGDPLRAKFIAENFLTDAVCYTETRGMYGFTGFYKGKRVSVQGTGMGGPSIHIYATELITGYGAKNLIRIGTAGSSSEKLPLGAVVLANGASNDSGMNVQRFGNIQFAPVPSFELLLKAYNKAAELGIDVNVLQAFTNDAFYDEKGAEKCSLMKRYNCCAVEMETAELYTLAAGYSVNALSILTISDLMYGDYAKADALTRQTAYKDMITIALEIA